MANRFATSKSTERAFVSALRKVARVAGAIVHAQVNGSTLRDEAVMLRLLSAYAQSLTPWAEHISSRMVASVSASNKRAFARQAKQLHSALAASTEMRTAQLLQLRQVELIKSLPIEAGLRAQKLAQEAAIGGKRADEVAAELLRTEDVTKSRAELIARTEVARANAAITQARAELVGATQYIWQTAEDGDVRDSHAAMQGQAFSFNDPPEVDEGGAYNPGEIYNCRCFAEPILPDEN